VILTGFFNKVINGLNKTRESFLNKIDSFFARFKKIDDELFDDLEDILIMSDIGLKTSDDIISEVKKISLKKKSSSPIEIKEILVDQIKKILEQDNNNNDFSYPCVILVIGVNGAGKTTSIGKLANLYKNKGKRVMLAAADTFRAAAIDQLEVWADRINIPMIKHKENADPGAVVYDAIQSAKAKKIDVLICDTAGRLHNKINLMNELKKIFKIIKSEFGDAHLEVFISLDATTGQNAIQQVKLFNEAANITGIILTKLDSTAKGGIIIPIKNELKIPVRFVGVGEKIDDIQEFDADEFVHALFENNS